MINQARIGTSTANFLLRSIIGSAIIGLLIFVLLVSLAPDATAFSPNNYGWNGMSQVDTTFSVHYIGSLTGAIDAREKSVLLVIQPVRNFSGVDTKSIASFVKSGGTLVVADDFGTSNSLLDLLGIGIRIEPNLSVIDPIYNWKTKTLPTALVMPDSSGSFPFMEGVRGLGLNLPSPLVVTGAKVLATSSTISFAVSRPNRTAISSQLLGNEGAMRPLDKGPFVVAAVQVVGNGRVVVVGDSQLFSNPEWRVANNQRLVTNLLSDSVVYLDTSHWPENTIASIKALLTLAYKGLSPFPLFYLATAGFVAVSVLIGLPFFPGPELVRERDRPRKSIETGTAYNKEILDRVRRDRKRYGIR